MRKIILQLILLAVVFTMQAQEKFYIYKNDGVSVGVPITMIDDITFSNDNLQTNLNLITGQTQSYAVSAIDSFSVGESANVLHVVYNGTSASVINPLAFEGVEVIVKNGDVEVRSTSPEEIEYVLTGTATAGSFKIYSDTKYILTLNGISLTNGKGPAINSQSSKKATVNLVNGTENTLMDGAVYTPNGNEDMKGCMFSEGQFVFEGGEGTLNVTSKSKHAICSDDHLIVKNGVINVLGAASDGMHTNDYFKISGGVVNIDKALSDGIEIERGYILIEGGKVNINIVTEDKKGMKCEGDFTMNDGEVSITIPSNDSHGIKSGTGMTFNGGKLMAVVAGDGAKGIKSVGDLVINDGAIHMDVTGSTFIVGSSKSYCTGIKCDKDFTQYSGTVNLICTGQGSRGLSADGTVNKKGGVFNVELPGSKSLIR